MPSGGGEIIIIAFTSAEGLPAAKLSQGWSPCRHTCLSKRPGLCLWGGEWGFWPPGGSWLRSRSGEGAETHDCGRLCLPDLGVKFCFSPSSHLRFP